MAVQTLMTVEEFDRLPAEERRLYELVRGELVPVFEKGMTTARYGHNYVRDRILRLLLNYLSEHSVGEAVAEQEFRITQDIVRRPDIAFVSSERLGILDPEKHIMEGVPDLAVEVVSDSDSAESIERKTDEYLQAGCREVWLAFWRLSKIHVYGRGEILEARGGGSPTAPELLPGFTMELDRVFEN